MKLNSILTVCVVLTLAPMLKASPRQSFPQAEIFRIAPEAPAPMPFLAAAGDEKDPGYKLYKAGYKLILDEKWDEARKQFAEVVDKHPKSAYLDACKYWTAFALKHTDRKRAIDAYTKFVKDFPHSEYYDDAVADLGQLNDVLIIDSSVRSAPSVVHIGRGEHGFETPNGWVVGSGRSFLGPHFDRGMIRLSRSLRRMSHGLGRITPVPVPIIEGERSQDELDPQTKLKLDALYALGDSPEDSSSFKAVKDIAVDRRQPQELRTAAMDVLADFKRFDLLPIYLEIAKGDTSEEMQTTAIDYIGEISTNKAKAVETLAELYASVPASRRDQRSALLASIAEIGNDAAIDFLTKIARSDASYDVRSEAVYYLGSIGGKKARAALYEILQGK